MMLRARITAGIAAAALAATPTLVRAAAVCRCADHVRLLAPAAKQKRSCCHGKKKATAQAPRVERDRMLGHRCCSTRVVKLTRGPATVEQRVLTAGDLPPLWIASLGQPAAPRGRTSLGARSCRGPPRSVPLRLLHCVHLL